MSLLHSPLPILAKQRCDHIVHTWSTTLATELILILIQRDLLACSGQLAAILDAEFVIAHPCWTMSTAVVHSVDAPPTQREVAKGLVGGIQQQSPRWFIQKHACACMCVPALKSKLEKMRQFKSDHTHSAHTVPREPWNPI
jgi:hypothetical protein